MSGSKDQKTPVGQETENLKEILKSLREGVLIVPFGTECCHLDDHED